MDPRAFDNMWRDLAIIVVILLIIAFAAGAMIGWLV